MKLLYFCFVKMKQAVIILLITIYALSSLGVSVKGFYCCGKLTTVSIALADFRKNKTTSDSKSDDCCKTKYQSLKVTDSHLTTAHIMAPASLYAEANIFFPFRYEISFITKEEKVINGSHAPPLYRGIPSYISHCVFRI